MSEILIYQNEAGNIKVDVMFEDESIWLSQKQLSEVFGKSIKTINEHVNNIFTEEELSKEAVIRNYRITASDGKNYDVSRYNLDMIIVLKMVTLWDILMNFKKDLEILESLKSFFIKKSKISI